MKIRRSIFLPITIKRLHVTVFVFFCLCLTVALVDPFPKHDYLGWAVPRAELIAQGHWSRVLNGGVPPWLMMVGGAIRGITGLNPFVSVMIASVLAYALAAYPIWFMISKVWSRRTAAWGVLLYLLCDETFLTAAGGIRTSWGVCSLAFVMLATVNRWHNGRWRAWDFLWLLFGWGSYCLNRDEGVVFLGVWLFLSLLAEVCVFSKERGWSKKALALASLTSVSLVVMSGWWGLKWVPMPRDVKNAARKIIELSVDCPRVLSLKDGEASFVLDYPGLWDIELSNGDWLEVEPKSGEGSTTIRLKSTLKKDTVTQHAKIKVNGLFPAIGHALLLTIYQTNQRVGFDLPTETVTVGWKKGATVEVPIKRNDFTKRYKPTVYFIDSTGKWLHGTLRPFDIEFVAPEDDATTGTIQCVAKENFVARKSETYRVVVNVAGLVKSFKLKQDAAPYSASNLMAFTFGKEWRKKWFMVLRGFHGLYWPILFLAISVVYWRRQHTQALNRSGRSGSHPAFMKRSRRPSPAPAERALLLFLLIGSALFIAIVFFNKPYLGRRHVVVLLPTLLGWAAVGLRFLRVKLIRRGNRTRRRRIVNATLVLIGMFTLYRGAEGVRDRFRYADRVTNTRAAINWLKNNRDTCLRMDSAPLHERFQRYAEPRMPVAYTTNAFVQAYAELDSISFSSDWESLAKRCRSATYNADIAIADYHFGRIVTKGEDTRGEQGKYPVLNGEIPPGFKVLFKSQHGKMKDHIWILKNTYLEVEAEALVHAGEYCRKHGIELLFEGTGHPRAKELAKLETKRLRSKTLDSFIQQGINAICQHDKTYALLLPGSIKQTSESLNRLFDGAGSWVSMDAIPTSGRPFTLMRLKPFGNSAERAKLSGMELVGTDAPGVLTIPKSRTIIGKAFYEIDSDKAYLLTARLRSSGKKPSRTYVGFVPYDKNKRRITHQSVDPCGKETVLISPCKKEDTILYVKDASDWIKYKYALIAFDIDDTGEFKDLPNFNLSSRGVVEVRRHKEEGERSKGTEAAITDHYAVHLAKPCGKGYPSGTPVRQHKFGGTYMYTAASNVVVPQGWTTYSGMIYGDSRYYVSNKSWWPGTKYVKILILANYGKPEDTKGQILEIDWIKLEVFTRPR